MERNAYAFFLLPLPPSHLCSLPPSPLQVSYGFMERNAYAFVTQKLAAAWLAMRLDVMGLLILTGTGEEGRRDGR